MSPVESELIARLRRRIPPHPLLRLGPGDDAAVLRMAGRGDCVMTVDLLTDGVDFELDRVDPRRVGRKALAVNLSDLAAMAAQAPKRGQSDPNAPDAPEAFLLGGPVRDLLDKARAASPITYITPDDPPFLIMHGDNDRVVPYQQSVLLDEALRKAGVESKLHTVAGGGHAFGGQALHEMVLDFFDRHLKSRPAASPTDATAKPTPAVTVPVPASGAAPAPAPMQPVPTTP